MCNLIHNSTSRCPLIFLDLLASKYKATTFNTRELIDQYRYYIVIKYSPKFRILHIRLNSQEFEIKHRHSSWVITL